MSTRVPRHLRKPRIVNPVRVSVLLTQDDLERGRWLMERYGIPLSHQLREGLKLYQERLGLIVYKDDDHHALSE